MKKHTEFALLGQWDMVTKTNGQQSLHIFDADGVSAGYISKLSLPLDSSPDAQNIVLAKILVNAQQNVENLANILFFCSSELTSKLPSDL